MRGRKRVRKEPHTRDFLGVIRWIVKGGEAKRDKERKIRGDNWEVLEMRRRELKRESFGKYLSLFLPKEMIEISNAPSHLEI